MAKEYISRTPSQPTSIEPTNLFSQESSSTTKERRKAIPFAEVENPQFSFIDLFAGVGGFRLALQNLGGRCVFSSEWDRYAQITYQANFGDKPYGDITLEETKAYIPEEFDMLCAGFPCQPFSIAGRRQGFEETRGTLFFDIADILRLHRPRAVFLENVKNLMTHDRGNTMRVIRETLQGLGYVVHARILNSMTHANIPQNRERIFIVALERERVPRAEEFSFPTPIPLTKTIHDILIRGEQEAKYYYPPTHQYYPKLQQEMTSRDTLYQWRRIYVRENKNKVCPTLTANMGTGGHNVPLLLDDFGIRKLTPLECFAFQSYPMDRFILPESLPKSKLYMQAGNSVTTPLIQRIGQEILRIL